MDVHPPHHAISTWRDFFIHMATICVGLLIAIGLEQSVEAIHRAQERHELRVALDRDSRQAIVDSGRSKQYADVHIAWLLARIGAAQTALAAHVALASETSPQSAGYDVASDPAFQAAKSSGALSLLSQEDIRAYSEADWVTLYLGKAFDDLVVARSNARKFAIELGPASGRADFAKAGPADIQKYLGLLTDELLADVRLRFWSEEVGQVEGELLTGDRDLLALQKAEHSRHTPIPGLAPRP
ncbi:MAG: hypothetical protein ABSD74_07100 [Rhizomicrobium sp.]|jgi:hypothetical protein